MTAADVLGRCKMLLCFGTVLSYVYIVIVNIVTENEPRVRNGSDDGGSRTVVARTLKIERILG